MIGPDHNLTIMDQTLRLRSEFKEKLVLAFADVSNEDYDLAFIVREIIICMRLIPSA